MPCASAPHRLLPSILGLVGILSLGGSLVFPRSLVAAPAEDAKQFEATIAPILVRNCVRCHNATQATSELDLTHYDRAKAGGETGAPAIVPGNVDESYLIERVTNHEMPPEGKGKPLTDDEIAQLTEWVKAGALWPEGRVLSPFEFTTESRGGRDWWSLTPPVRPAVPAVEQQNWVRTPIDAFVLAKLEEQHLKPADETPRATLIRRAKLDLVGLPPTPEEIAEFVDDPASDAYERLIDRLLASPQYGERWGRHWLDIVRFAESNGYETNTARASAWPYRDYVIAALNEDRPYPRFIAEQLAGDQLGAGTATGYLVGGTHDVVASPDVELTLQQRLNDLDDMLSTTSTTFLGLTVGCAKCHDHKFDAISQRDYYALQAMFAGVQHGERAVEPRLDERERETLEKTRSELAAVESQLQTLVARYEPLANPGGRIWIDDVAAQNSDPTVRSVSVLVPPIGSVSHTAGTERGQLQDAGDVTHLPNFGRGYTYWNNVAGKDVFSWNPAAPGRQRIWVSWGCGWGTHSPDAQYVLDADGDLATKDDQKVIATADHRRFSDGSGNIPSQALWSGLLNAGVHTLGPSSRIVLRGGVTDAYITADVLLLESQADREPSVSDMPSAAPAVRPAVHALGNVERFAPVEARWIRFSVQATNQYEPCIDELEIFTAEANPRNVALASTGAKTSASSVYADGTTPIHKLEHINDGRYGNSRSWISKEVGGGWVQIELAAPALINRITWARDREGAFTDRLPTQYKIEVANQPDQWRTVASSDDRPAYDRAAKPASMIYPGLIPATEVEQLRKLEGEAAALRAKLPQAGTQMVYAGTFTQPGPTYRLHRGEPLQKQEEVAPGTLSFVGKPITLSLSTPEAERRVALAKWIGDPENPLTARVMVNRIWHYHFGQGLVKTPSDFGFNGGQPSHPELLDWLATEFIAQGWRTKAMHRMIMLSSVYRQSSRYDAAAAAIDAGDRLLWRFNPRRLEAEPIRDAMLSISGALDPRMGGPGYDAFEPNDNYVKVYNAKQTFGTAEWRRMVYQAKPRMRQDGTFGEFDCPDSSQSTSRRNVSTTALQALNLLNGSFVVQQAGIFAERLRSEAPADVDAQIRRAFWLAFGRAPADDELAAARRLIETESLPIFCRAILNGNEFVYIN